MENYRKYQTQSDLSFWTSMSVLVDMVTMVRFQNGKGIKRDLKRLMYAEEKIANIEL